MKKKEVNKDIINLDDDLTLEEFQKEITESKKEITPKEVELVALEDTVEIKEEIKERETKLNDPDYDFSLIDKKTRRKRKKAQPEVIENKEENKLDDSSKQQEIIEEKKDDINIQDTERENKLNSPDYDFSLIDRKTRRQKKKELKKTKSKEDNILEDKLDDSIKEQVEIKEELPPDKFIIEEKSNITEEELFFPKENKLDNDTFDIKDNLVSKSEKSKLSIFLLILSLLVLVFYAFNIYRNLDKTNLDILTVLTSTNVIFVFVSLIVILILFKLNNKKTTPYVLLLTLVLIGYTMFSTSYAKETDTYVLDFINKDIKEVMDWADENKLELEILHEFSDTVEKNHVIMQQYGITTLVKDIKTKFQVTISDGPNLDKELVVPNMTGLTFEEVMQYIKDNSLSNVVIEFIKSDATRDTVIEQIGSGTMKRNDEIKFTFSYGPDELEKVPVKDLKNLSEFEATAYLKRYNIPYEIEYQHSNDIEKGYVISQSIVEKIVEDKLTLVISKGSEIVVPDLLNMTTSEITKWAMENNIDIKFNEEYNKEIESGKVIKASREKGDKVSEDEVIEIVISKGSLKMPKIDSLASFKIWANENNIKYEEQYEFSDKPKDTVIKTFPAEGTNITTEDTVIITISRGKEVTVPNLTGLSKSEIQSKCKEAKLSCTFTYGSYTESTKRDISLSQSKRKGTVVGEGTNVTITLSSGIYEKVEVPSFIGKTKQSIQSSCNSIGVTCNFTYNSSFSKEAKDTALKQDKTGTVIKGTTINITLSKGQAQTYNVVITGEYLSQGNPDKTKETLKSLLESNCPGVKFTFTFKPSNSGIGYLNENSQVKVGNNTLTEGNTYNIIINSN